MIPIFKDGLTPDMLPLLLLVGLILLLVLLQAWLLWRYRQFLRRLTHTLSHRSLPTTALGIERIPARFRPLCSQLDALITRQQGQHGRDKLTGLLNRVGFKAIIGQTLTLGQVPEGMSGAALAEAVARNQANHNGHTPSGKRHDNHCHHNASHNAETAAAPNSYSSNSGSKTGSKAGLRAANIAAGGSATDSLAEQGTLVLLDIYRFRYVNDLFGFEFGDTLLRAFAERLNKLQHPPALLARLNGDEFVLYWPQAVDRQQIMRLKGRLQVPFDIQGTPVRVRVQFGVLSRPHFDTHPSILLRRLDLALKKGREAKDLIGFYADGDDTRQHRELTLINSLPKGLISGEFYLVFQPKQAVTHLDACPDAGLPDGAPLQVEALLRWNHHLLGAVSPAEFIPLAEYAGMIGLVSRWTLTRVLEQQQIWRSRGVNVQVAVNLSTRDLTNDTLCEDISAQLTRFELPADALMIEITESTLMANIDKALHTLRRLRTLGVKLAIDDFGTGHSSLAYLKHLPVDEVKIDKAFVADLLTDPQAGHIMETSIMLATKLGFEVTVEGVETPQVQQALIRMGADKLQGDLIAPPMTAEALEHDWYQPLAARAADAQSTAHQDSMAAHAGEQVDNHHANQDK